MTSAKAVVFETGHTEIIHDAQLDYYGKRLATAASDHTIRIFDIAADKQTLLNTIAAHDGPVYQLSWAHPKFGSILASASYDGRVLIFKEVAHNQWSKVYEYFKADSAINSVQFAPHTHGLVVAVGAADGTVVILTRLNNNTWDIQSFLGHKGGVTSVSWGPDIRPNSLHSAAQNVATLRVDRRLVTGGCDCAIRIWRNSASDTDNAATAAVNASPSQSVWIDTQSIPVVPLPHADWVRDVAWSPSIGQSASHIAAASTDKTVSLWAENADGQFRRVDTLKFDQPVWRVSWSLMGGMLAISEGDGKVSLWKETNDGQWKQVSQEQAPPQ